MMYLANTVIHSSNSHFGLFCSHLLQRLFNHTLNDILGKALLFLFTRQPCAVSIRCI